jgi:adenosylcobinamide-phosphate synthase
MSDALIIILLAMLLDELIGDPAYRFHPVRMMGSLFQIIEKIIRKKGDFLQSVTARRIQGVLYLVICSLIPLAAFYLLYQGLFSLWKPLTWLLCVYVYYSTYAQKDLLLHAKNVFTALEENSLTAARKRVSHMVGRNTTRLDEPGIIRAAVESVAENYVDGSFTLLSGTITIFTVAFFFGFSPLLPVLTWSLFFRAVNTLDAMVGYKNEKYSHFGWASARLDDLLNYIPARLSFFPLTAGVILHKGNLKRAFSDFFHYRNATPSPNSGHPESFMAGALNIQLAGPIAYRDGIVDRGWIGSGTDIPDRRHLIQAVQIVSTAGRTFFLAMALLTVYFTLFYY